MVSVTLYGMAISTCTKRCRMALEEKGVEYKLVEIDLMKGEHKTPEHLARQPFGKVPVLEVDGVLIFESRAIIRYIARKWKGQGTELLGTTLEEEALTENWLEVESQYYNDPVSTIAAERIFKKWRGETSDEELVKAKITQLEQVLDVYEARLSKTPYLGGSEFTLADLSHMPYTEAIMAMAGVTAPLEQRPHVKAWWGKITSRPTWKKLSAPAA